MNPAPSDTAFIQLDRLEQVDQLVERSFTQPVIVFKHSPACGTSAYAFDELDTYRQEPSAHDVYIVDVLRSRPLSQAIAARFGVHHQSPQLLLIALLPSSAPWRACPPRSECAKSSCAVRVGDVRNGQAG
jgi:bacillithiol system protein YtxJ